MASRFLGVFKNEMEHLDTLHYRFVAYNFHENALKMHPGPNTDINIVITVTPFQCFLYDVRKFSHTPQPAASQQHPLPRR